MALTNFQVEDVISLLNTNDGVYAAACSMDFSKPPSYYDTFALRDSRGNEHTMETWPYFRSAMSRNALLAMSSVPVKSCWNGMGMLFGYIIICLTDLPYSRHADRPFHIEPPITLPRSPRLSSRVPPRRLRMLPNPRRQPPFPN